MIFRKAILDDIEDIIQIRKRQLIDEGQDPCVDMDNELRKYFRDKMSNDEMIEWIAEDDGHIIATSAIIFMDFPPSFTCSGIKRGYVANMYTQDAYRGQGIAGKLLEKLEDEARKRGITRLFLLASDLGRKAYVKSGYEEADIFMEKGI